MASIPKPWLGVELRHLAALAAVHKEGSFRGAAESLGYVQSAISQQVARLEGVVGGRLIERSRGTAPVALTPAGELLLEHVDEILARFEAAQADLSALADGAHARLRVGVFASVGTRVMPSVMSKLTAQSPWLRVVPVESPTESDLFELVHAGQIDVAFAELPLEAGPFATCELMSDPCVLLVQAGGPLAFTDVTPTLDEIAALPLIKNPSWRGMERVEAALRGTGTEPEFVLCSGTDATVQALVGAGLGSAVVRRLAVDMHQPATVALDVDDMPASRLALFWHRERRPSQALATFCAAASAACGQLFAPEPVLTVAAAG